ncbi:MAG: AlpA family phage regulatory protein [Comamonas sp.]
MTELAKHENQNLASAAGAISLSMSVIRLPKLLQILGISRSTVYLKINKSSKYYDKEFPLPIKLGEKAVGWVLQDVFNYIELIKRGTKSLN